MKCLMSDQSNNVIKIKHGRLELKEGRGNKSMKNVDLPLICSRSDGITKNMKRCDDSVCVNFALDLFLFFFLLFFFFYVF